MNKEKLIGVISVAIGACSYGALASIVKLAYLDGFKLPEVTFAQYSVGWVLFLILFLIRPKESLSSAQVIKLIGFGTTLGLTGLLYYQSVKYIPVSFAIVLLMQSTWMGIILDRIVLKHKISITKLIGSLLVISGAVLCSNVYNKDISLDFIGLTWGLLAAVSYTITIYASAHIVPQLNTIQRTFWLSSGGFAIIVMFVGYSSTEASFNFEIFNYWGLLLALFGTVLPPFLFAYGMPKVGVSTGTILGALELPVSVTCAYIFLNENLTLLNIIGLILILSAIVLVNLKAQPADNLS